jgi:hypothetical protein
LQGGRIWVWIAAYGNVGAIMLPNRALVAGFACAIAGLVVPTITGHAQQSAAAITCTNPASGASWQIRIDYGKATVDAFPAKISRAEISWFDRKEQGNYTLDRKSGDLTATIASSTGGYFRRSRCTLEKSQ